MLARWRPEPRHSKMASGTTSLEDGDRKQDGDLGIRALYRYRDSMLKRLETRWRPDTRWRPEKCKRALYRYRDSMLTRWRPEPRHWKMATGYTSLEDGDWIQDGSTRHWKMASSIFSADVVR